MLEFYEAYRDYRYLWISPRKCCVLGNHGARSDDVALSRASIDLAKGFERLTIPQAIRKFRPGDRPNAGSAIALS